MRGVKIGLRLDFLKKRKEFELFTLLIFLGGQLKLTASPIVECLVEVLLLEVLFGDKKLHRAAISDH